MSKINQKKIANKIARDFRKKWKRLEAKAAKARATYEAATLAIGELNAKY